MPLIDAIACLNYPDNPWVNVVYELTAGKLKEINTKVWFGDVEGFDVYSSLVYLKFRNQ